MALGASTRADRPPGWCDSIEQWSIPGACVGVTLATTARSSARTKPRRLGRFPDR